MIKNSQLILSWYIKRSPEEVNKENIHDVLSILKELSMLLTNILHILCSIGSAWQVLDIYARVYTGCFLCKF